MKQTDKKSTTNFQPKRSVRSQIRENKSNQPPRTKNTDAKPLPVKQPDTNMESEEASQNPKQNIINLEKERDESDSETVTDSVSTTSGDEKLETIPVVSQKPPENKTISTSTKTTPSYNGIKDSKGGVKVHPKLSSSPSSVSS